MQSTAKSRRRRAIQDIAYLLSQESPSDAKSNGQGADRVEFLPEEVRHYLADPSATDWNPNAVYTRVRIAGADGTVEFLRNADYQRECAAYRDRGFKVHPRTGEKLT